MSPCDALYQIVGVLQRLTGGVFVVAQHLRFRN